VAQRKSESGKKPKRLGRPPVEVKKKPFQVMLDPRYIDYFRKVARKKKIQPQDLVRVALYAFLPDPFNPVPGLIEEIAPLIKKRKR
jgi:hypothetical protein